MYTYKVLFKELLFYYKFSLLSHTPRIQFNFLSRKKKTLYILFKLEINLSMTKLVKLFIFKMIKMTNKP